eukprot:scaffold20357_cov69-Phaeocystis_antarctica.AAC.1
MHDRRTSQALSRRVRWHAGTCGAGGTNAGEPTASSYACRCAARSPGSSLHSTAASRHASRRSPPPMGCTCPRLSPRTSALLSSTSSRTSAHLYWP